MASTRALQLLERIASLLRAEVRRTAAEQGLEPVHIMALDYLARANRFSDNPLAVGEYLGLTKGNMSQRLNVLETKGLIQKASDKEDRRRVHLKVTKRGQAVLRASYPPQIWPTDQCGGEALESALDAQLRSVLARHGGRAFGQCQTCRFHEQRNAAPYCGLVGVALRPAEALQICREHEVNVGGRGQDRL